MYFLPSVLNFAAFYMHWFSLCLCIMGERIYTTQNKFKMFKKNKKQIKKTPSWLLNYLPPQPCQGSQSWPAPQVFQTSQQK